MGKDNTKECKPRRKKMDNGAIYGLGVIGAAVYFIQTSTGFWMGVVGVLKGFVWPAIVIYKVLEMMKM